MSAKLRMAYFAHSLRSDWNNGNAHFLRGLMRAMTALGHAVTIYEPQSEWSLENLRTEVLGSFSLEQFSRSYHELNLETYAASWNEAEWLHTLEDTQIVILHEWAPPELAQRLISLRAKLGFRLLFHDTHHRASSSPDQMAAYGLNQFDGILAFGESLKSIYQQRFHIEQVWALHEAADTTIFKPVHEGAKQIDGVWIGNWGEGERSSEITEFYLKPASFLAGEASLTIYGVRYPEPGLRALSAAGVCYGGYLPNLEAPKIYAASRFTVHIPRQQYSSAMAGIPTIRVFEALACGIPLLSAPWQDTEELFRPGDLRIVRNAMEMAGAMRSLLNEPAAAEEQARRGLETVLARHTCAHRAEQLTAICQDLLA